MKCFETIRKNSDAGERTRDLHRRELYRTTSCQSLMNKRVGNHTYLNNENGNLLLLGNKNNANQTCLLHSKSYRDYMDVNRGFCLEKAITNPQYDGAVEKSGKGYESQFSVVDYQSNIVTNISQTSDASKYNRLIYDVNGPIDTTNVAYPGVIVDPSGVLFTSCVNSMNFVDVCFNTFSGQSYYVDSGVTSVWKEIVRENVYDTSFAFPLRTSFY